MPSAYHTAPPCQIPEVQKGLSLPTLERLLGNDRLTITEIYLNLSPEDVVRECRDKW